VAQDASIGTLSCWPGGNCADAGTYSTAAGGDHVFAVCQTLGDLGRARADPGFRRPARTLRPHLVLPVARQLHPRRRLFQQPRPAVVRRLGEERDVGRARPLPDIAALNTGQPALLEGLACFSAGGCTAAGDYAIAHKKYTTAAVFATAEKTAPGASPCECQVPWST